MVAIDLEELRRIRKYTILALFSDDYFLEKFVLKGGNALDIVYKLTDRPSRDIDVSMEDDFSPAELPLIEARLKRAIVTTFREHGYVAFDFRLNRKPKRLRPDQPEGWGGYEIKFKLMTETQYGEYSANPEKLSGAALQLGEDNQLPLTIDISKHEFCKTKVGYELDSLKVFVYTPEMIVIEKLRSICQQMEEYAKHVGKSYRVPRARDFYDIYLVSTKLRIDLATEQNVETLKAVFSAKSVPLSLLGRIKNYRDFHEKDYSSLESTASPKEKLKPFEFYFEYVVRLCDSLKSFWEE